MNYVPNTDADRAAMLEVVGAASIDELFEDIPRDLHHPSLNLPQELSELALKRTMSSLAGLNASADRFSVFLGAGAYNHFVPAVVHHVTGRSEFYTAYTPYQAEASQGTLQTIFEYQTAVCQLTGMDVANASMYDGATAVAEAAIMAQHATQRHKIVVSPTVHPDYVSVIETYTSELGSIVVSSWSENWARTGKTDLSEVQALVDDSAACLVVQHPNFFGCLEDVELLADAVHKAGALLIVIVDPISLGMLRAPGSYGADVAVGEGQSLGNPMSFGGPYLGLFATEEKLLRLMPGRIVGQAADREGRRGFVLTLQAREQHIRREKATSNICTNEALDALAALVYLSAMGPRGLRQVAETCVRKAHYAADRIADVPGYELAFPSPFFKEFVIRCPRPPAEINAQLLKQRIIGGYDLSGAFPALADHMLLCVTEMNTRDEIDRLVDILASGG